MPMAFIMPSGSSQTRGMGLPVRISLVIVLVTRAPSWLKSSRWVNSSAKVPDAGITGFFRRSRPTFTLKSIIASPPPDQRPGFQADPFTHPHTLDFKDLDAALAHAQAAYHLLLKRNLAEQTQFGRQLLEQPRSEEH